MYSALMFAALGIVPHVACAEWSVADAAPGMAGCSLETQEISLFDGYSDTRVRLSVADGALRVKTESNIDSGFNDVGLAVDGKTFMPADAVVDEKEVLFSSDIDAVIDQFIRGNSRDRVSALLAHLSCDTALRGAFQPGGIHQGVQRLQGMQRQEIIISKASGPGE